VKRLGIGGMGEVWRAEHDTLARPAALKVIKRQALSDPKLEQELLERFRKEAEVTARLSSPHTVVLYDFGVTDDGALYYAMELLEGLSMLAIVQRHGPMGEARVAFLMRHACHSLIEAHERGLVHRDLKPENLFVAHLGRDRDFLKVLDFGLVKELDSHEPVAGKRPRQQLTVAGARPGTPGFMAPEQIVGTASIDQRADIYALGCVMFHALTGSPVFAGDVEAQLLFAHVDVDPETPSQRVGRPLHPGLEAVVMRCLAKDPSARPQTMEAVDELLAALSFERPWSQARARRWWGEVEAGRPPADA
jgi:serine/threonine-protein kinase